MSWKLRFLVIILTLAVVSLACLPGVRTPTAPALPTLPPLVQPTQPFALPTQPMVLPTQPMVLPTQPMVLPTQPMVLPTQPIQQPTAVQSRPVFTFVTWASAVDSSYCPTTRVTTFPTGTTVIHAIFGWSGMAMGVPYAWKWTYNGRDVASGQNNWNSTPSGQCYDFNLYNRDGALPDGSFVLTVMVNNVAVGTATTSIGGTSGPVNPTPGTPSGGVLLNGNVVDATTNQPIADALLVILKPGVDVNKWLESGTDDQVFAFARSDYNGAFSMNNRVQRQTQYGLAVGAKNYRLISGTINLKPDTPDVFTYTFKMSKQ